MHPCAEGQHQVHTPLVSPISPDGLSGAYLVVDVGMAFRFIL